MNIHAVSRQSREIFSEYRHFPGCGQGRVVLRYDDSCGNGHNTFSITVDSKAQHARAFGGCMHLEIEEVFPEYAHLIKWHLCTTNGPTYYLANTLYLASDRDHHGLLKGEKQQIIDGQTKKPVWKLVDEDGNPPKTEYQSSDKRPQYVPWYTWVPVYRVGNGRKTDLEGARSTAVAPNATLEQLRDEEWLRARLPGLIEEFKAEMEKLYGHN